MRTNPKQTMRGYLLMEANRLMHDGGARTSSLKKLYRRSRRPENSRSREYVFLYALEEGRLDALRAMMAEPDPPLSGVFAAMPPRVSPAAVEYARALELSAGYDGDAEGFLRDNGDALGKRYSQIVAAFDHPLSARASGERRKAAWLAETKAALSESGTSACSLAAASGVDKGNLCAYLRGETRRLSVDTARLVRDAALNVATRRRA